MDYTRAGAAVRRCAGVTERATIGTSAPCARIRERLHTDLQYGGTARLARSAYVGISSATPRHLRRATSPRDSDVGRIATSLVCSTLRADLSWNVRTTGRTR